MSEQKWKEIERNLAEQESFVQTIMQQREKRTKPENNANIDNILSSSIQRAKEKISSIEAKNPRTDRPSDNLAQSRQRKERVDDNGGVAGAMKKLQESISQKEKENQRLQGDLDITLVKLKKSEQLQRELQRSVEEGKRKIKNLEITIFNDKAWIKELDSKIEVLEKSIQPKEGDDKISNWEMMFRAREEELESAQAQNQSYEQKILDLTNQLQEEKFRLSEESSLSKSLQKELELKVATLQERIKQKDNLIEGLREEIKKSEMDKLKFSRALLAEEEREREQPDHGQLEMLRQNFEALRQKYDQVLQSYHNLEERGQRDKLDAKNYRNKFWQLKEVMKDMTDKIQSLPNAVTSQLKYLIIKANKIEVYTNEYYASTPTKSARKTSLLNKSTERSKSKSKSKSKQKSLKFQELDQSNRSIRSKKSVKSRSNSSKKETGKKVIVSQKTIRNDEIGILEAEIQSIRKKYKELVMSQSRSGEEVGEQTRQELNNLAMLLQEKSEQLTKLKRGK